MKIVGPIPSHILQLMPKADREPLGKAGLTAPEIDAKNSLKLERQIQAEIGQWLNLHDIPFIQAPVGKKSGIAEGHPDFTIFVGGRTFCIEVKRPGQSPEQHQKERMEQLQKEGVICSVEFSLPDVISTLKDHGIKV